MSHVSRALLTDVIAEVALWCSRERLVEIHEDSPDEARRRELMKEAGRILTSTKYPGDSWLSRFLPNGRRWERAMTLLREADPYSLATLEHQLRSPTLRPIDSIGNDYSEESRQEMVNRVIDLRSSLIKLQTPPEHGIPGHLRGRLLLYVPSENVSDGASAYASNGFFDLNDCPPWDIWLRYSDRTLISWVPEILLPLAQAGIDANPVACIQWAD